MNKISIIGAGMVGETAAQELARKEIASEINLVDIREGAAEGSALDIQETAPILGFDTKIRGSNDIQTVQGSDLIIITAGVARKPGMSRSDILDTNLNVLDSILDPIIEMGCKATLMLVSNPVDILTYYTWRKTGFDKSKVFGQAGVLDSTRMASFIAMESGFSVKDINTMVLGGHGDTMVPLPSHTTINGVGIDQFLTDEVIEEIIQRTRQGGSEILELRRTNSAYQGPASAIQAMVSSISVNQKRLLPTVTILEGEYGYHDLAIGVPVVLGRNGVEKVIELNLNEKDKAEFDKSIQSVRKDLATLKQLRPDIIT